MINKSGKVLNLKKVLSVLSLNLLISVAALSQAGNTVESELVRKFARFCETNPREELYIQTDREEYIAGEDLWFSAYIFDRRSLIRSDRSRIAYVELINTENKTLVQKKIFLEVGTGRGQMILPDTLSTGKYILRAYTSWMKNFLPASCFIKEVTIYNALIPKGIPPAINEIRFQLPADHKYTRLTDDNKNISVKTELLPGGNLSIILTLTKYLLEADKKLIIFIQTRGNINLVQPVYVTGDSAAIIVPSSSLIPGINQITIFSQDGRPLKEKYFYTPSPDEAATIASSGTFNLRDYISLSVEAGNRGPGFLNGSRLSLSVAPVGNGYQFPDINDYLVFGNEFGYAPVKWLLGRKLQGIPSSEIDNMLDHIYSNWIDWDNILSDLPSEHLCPYEGDNHVLKGRLISGEQRSDLENSLIFICMPGKRSTFSYAKSDSAGHFSFSLHIDEALKDLVLIPEKIDKNDRIILESPFSDKFLQVEKAPPPDHKVVPEYIPKWSLNYQVSKIYRISARGLNLEPVTRPLREVRFYGVPDYEVKLADFIKLPVMEEVIFELLPQVSLKKRDGTFKLSINEYIGDGYYSKTPVLMIDGVVIRDASMIVNLDPEAVERIDVIRGDYLVGRYILTGLINVITKAGNFSDVQMPDYMTRTTYRVIDPVPSFISPDYSVVDARSNRIPDYRNTLFWNPLVVTDTKGKSAVSFWSSDNRGDYRVTVEGMTSAGKPFSASETITVR